MKNIFLLLFSISSVFAFSQSSDAYKKLAEYTCTCLESKDLNAQNLENQLGLCLMNAIRDNPKLIKGANLGNTGAMEKLGEKVGVQMAFICPEVFMLMIEEENKNIKKELNESKINSIAYGEIEGFENNELSFLLLKEIEGETRKYLWLRAFEGDTELLKMGNNAIGLKVTIEYNEIEIYNPKLGEYLKRKEIKAISF